MKKQFWTEEYFLSPDFEEMYDCISEYPNTRFFCSAAEVAHGGDLFYQLCVFDGFSKEKYCECEKNLTDAISKLLNKNKIVSYAASRKFVSNKRFQKLSGLNEQKLKNLIKICDTRQILSSQSAVESFLLCATRGLASTCLLAVEWKILFLIQDLHGCILYNEDSDQEGLKQALKLFCDNGFII